MSEISKHKCDNCGAETPDYHNEMGWIVFQEIHASVSAGRKGDKTVNTAIFIDLNETVDFCCISCMLHYFSTKQNSRTANNDQHTVIKHFKDMSDIILSKETADESA